LVQWSRLRITWTASARVRSAAFRSGRWLASWPIDFGHPVLTAAKHVVASSASVHVV